jgi:hypothetical protein
MAESEKEGADAPKLKAGYDQHTSPILRLCA